MNTMTDRKESRAVTQALDALYASAMRFMENGSRQPEIFMEVFKQLDTITQARRTRLHLSTGIVPGLLWLVLYVGAVLTVGFTLFFGTKNLPAQVMMTGILFCRLIPVGDRAAGKSRLEISLERLRQRRSQ